MLVWSLAWLMVFSTSSDPDPGPAGIPLSVGGTRLHPSRMSLSCYPGETLSLSTPDSCSWAFSGGEPASCSGTSASWTAPRRHGVVRLSLSSRDAVQEYALIILVDASRWRTTTLNSYPIGLYGDGNSRRDNPAAFIEMRQADAGVRLSSHFTLGEFLGHTEGCYPQYLALDLRLVDKLETLLSSLGESYPEPLDIHVFSGFRSPEYNSSIGNETDFSAHLYGTAADIWVESFPPNNLMDDVDRNKRIDIGDGSFIVDLTRRIEASGSVPVGGASAYRWTPQHGPFVHIDVRGRPASWQTQLNLVPDPVI